MSCVGCSLSDITLLRHDVASYVKLSSSGGNREGPTLLAATSRVMTREEGPGDSRREEEPGGRATRFSPPILAAQPEQSYLGSDGSHRGTLAAPSLDPPPLPVRSLSRHSPKAGAQCAKCARWDLCGGRQVTGVPTAIPDP